MDNDSDCDQPKAKTNTWLILAIVGGVLLVSCLGCGVIMSVILVPAVQRVRVAAEQMQRMNDLKQIGIAILNYMSAKGKGPSNLDDLSPYLLLGDTPMVRLQNGEIEVLWDLAPLTQQTDGTANVLTAWETRQDANKNGSRQVLYADGHVTWLTEDQFLTARKAKTLGGKLP
jgi:prepilin-type processing-associated H-X9-DG protein